MKLVLLLIVTVLGSGAGAYGFGRYVKSRAPEAPVPPPTKFGLGATEHDVRALLGAPTEIDEAHHMWLYGQSDVRFDDANLVSGWEAIDRPLPTE